MKKYEKRKFCNGSRISKRQIEQKYISNSNIEGKKKIFLGCPQIEQKEEKNEAFSKSMSNTLYILFERGKKKILELSE